MKRFVLFVVVAAVVMIAVACGEQARGATPTPTATASSSPTTVATAQPSPTETPVPPPDDDTGVGPGPGEEGLCISAAPLGVSVGDSWTLAGPITLEGNVAVSIPLDSAWGSTDYTVTAIRDGDWLIGDSTVLVENSKVQMQQGRVILDSDSNELVDEVQNLNAGAISVADFPPVLTLDWECHRQAWLQQETAEVAGGGSSGAEYSVDERLLSSGVQAVVFSYKRTMNSSETDFQHQTEERVAGYDKLTGRLVLLTTHSYGDRAWEHYDSEIVQELVSGDQSPTTGDGAGEIPDWLKALIRSFETDPEANPPTYIAQYEYKGQTVYYVPPRCCDIFSDLHDADGNIIGHPDGGITGQGDGRVPDFFDERTNEQVVWGDKRTGDSGLVEVPAPIESVNVQILESFPPQVVLSVVSGLPNGCVSFAGYNVTREGNTIRVGVTNLTPADPETVCIQIYGTVETRIHLGSDFALGTTYTATVNGMPTEFKP